ncbi:MAG: AtpZ/AtpI family protein [bacterium]|nr:AtpZ/AtpI family protein [bacterium]
MRDEDDRQKPKPPWWSESAPEETPLPDGFPERPDQAKVEELRKKIRADRAESGNHHRTPLHDRFRKDQGRAARDIGNYTLIPMMMLAGPVMGYLVGHYAEGRLGGEPWLGVGGALFGLVAAFRQIILMLQRKSGPGGRP